MESNLKVQGNRPAIERILARTLATELSEKALEAAVLGAGGGYSTLVSCGSGDMQEDE